MCDTDGYRFCGLDESDRERWLPDWGGTVCLFPPGGRETPVPDLSDPTTFWALLEQVDRFHSFRRLPQTWKLMVLDDTTPSGRRSLATRPTREEVVAAGLLAQWGTSVQP